MDFSDDDLIAALTAGEGDEMLADLRRQVVIYIDRGNHEARTKWNASIAKAIMLTDKDNMDRQVFLLGLMI